MSFNLLRNMAAHSSNQKADFHRPNSTHRVSHKHSLIPQTVNIFCIWWWILPPRRLLWELITCHCSMRQLVPNVFRRGNYTEYMHLAIEPRAIEGSSIFCFGLNKFGWTVVPHRGSLLLPGYSEVKFAGWFWPPLFELWKQTLAIS
jgi:hypothetical protein